MASPGKEGTQVGDIKTPMNAVNVGKKGSAGTKTYSEKDGAPSSSGGENITGPGTKGSYKGGA